MNAIRMNKRRKVRDTRLQGQAIARALRSDPQLESKEEKRRLRRGMSRIKKVSKSLFIDVNKCVAGAPFTSADEWHAS